MRVLVVDDSDTDRFRVTSILEKHGHEAITAANGEEGVAKARSELPDIVLMDVVMPKMNGFQATRKITTGETTSHIPVILITAKDQETDRVWGKRQGAKAYLTKVIQEDELLAAMKSVTGG